MSTSEVTRGQVDPASASTDAPEELFHRELEHVDPEMVRFMQLEEERQFRKIILIASESIAPVAVRQAMDSPFANLYAEGLPASKMVAPSENLRLEDLERHLAYFRRYGDRRYYKGCEYANFAESMAQRRAAALFATDRFEDSPVKVPASAISVNVQPLSGAAANNAVYTAFAKPGDTILGMSLVTGGHLTHGSKVNRSGQFFNAVSYGVNPETGRVDLDEIRQLAEKHRPRILIAGYSAYPFAIDWLEFRKIADSVGALLLADISHPSGLVVGGCFPSPVGVADVTMTTTHKTLCGPRGAILLTTDKEKARKIDLAVFPGEQGGPHVHNIAAKAVAFRMARSEEFMQLQRRVLRNSQHLAACLAKEGVGIAYGGTESHLFLVDLKAIEGKAPLEGEIVSRVLDLCGITCNKNTMAGDRSPMRPSAIRLGTTWITQRGFKDAEVETLAKLIARALHATDPYKVPGGKARGRARIAYEVMEEVKRDVEQLIRSVRPDFPEPLDFYAYSSAISRTPEAMSNPLSSEHAVLGGQVEPDAGWTTPASYGDADAEVAAARSAAALVDGFDGGLVRIAGPQATEFLQAAVSANLRDLAPGQGRRTLVLDPEGKVRSEAAVLRRADADGHPDYVLSTHPGDTATVVSWLRALSDGYVHFEPGDPTPKLAGPVVVEDLRVSPSDTWRRTRLLLLGSRAAEVLARVWNGASDLAAGHAQEVECDGQTVLLFRQPDRGEVPCYDLHVHPSAAGKLWNTLLEEGKDAGLRACGHESWRRIREESGGVATGADAAGCVGAGDLLEATKPFFVGQSATLSRANAASEKTEHSFEMPELPLRRTPLFDKHLERTMKSLMAPFGGWEMPLWYGKVSEEHEAVRETAALFDVSHMGVLAVRGEGARRFLDLVTTNDVSTLPVGKSQYSYLLDPTGTIVDDIIVYRMGQTDYQVVVNASNAEKVFAWLQAVLSGNAVLDRDCPARGLDVQPELLDLRDPAQGEGRRIDIALQGPASRAILQALAGSEDEAAKIGRLGSFRHCDATLAGIPAIVSGTGYTGESNAFELFVHPDHATKLWDAILSTEVEFDVLSGKDDDGNDRIERRKATAIPAGLAARDSARMEAGLPLYGHELAGEHDIDPIEAGYGSFVKFHKPFFIGRSPLLGNPERGVRKVVRFRCKKTRKFEPGDAVFNEQGTEIGTVLSCTLAGNAIVGLALVSGKGIKAGTTIGVVSKKRGGEPKPVQVLRRFPRRLVDFHREHGPLDAPLG